MSSPDILLQMVDDLDLNFQGQRLDLNTFGNSFFSQMLTTDRADIAIANKKEVAYDHSIDISTFELVSF